jgi:biopolymer transport protein ExbB/TolQ
MDSISNILFWVANSLLIPDILALLFLFVRSLLLVGKFYNQFTIKMKNDKLLENTIRQLPQNGVDSLKNVLPAKDNSLFVKHLRDLVNNRSNEAYADYVISSFEDEADKDLSTSKLLSKLGPTLGLIGTLIAMSPALVGLSTGDISGMAYNMQVVFATTVVGLVISVVGLVTAQFKQRWYAKETFLLDFVAQVNAQEIEKQKNISYEKKEQESFAF